jgi:hypothetical protein
LPLNFGQLFNILFCVKGFNSTQIRARRPGPTVLEHACPLPEPGQLSSRCQFLNRVAVRRHIAASQQCFKAKLGYCKIQMAARPGPATAWLERVVVQG